MRVLIGSLSVDMAQRSAAWTAWSKVRQTCVEEGLGRILLNRHDMVTIGASSEKRAKEAREHAVVIRRVLTEDTPEAPTGTV
jgi:hypothetical protein